MSIVTRKDEGLRDFLTRREQELVWQISAIRGQIASREKELEEIMAIRPKPKENTMSVEMKPVKSGNVAAVGHDPEAKTLHVAFRNGSRYIYQDVDAEKHAALMKADSVGSYLNAHIKGAHKFSKGGGE